MEVINFVVKSPCVQASSFAERSVHLPFSSFKDVLIRFFSTLNVKKLTRLAIVLALFFIVPSLISKIISYRENYARPIKFSTDVAEQFSYIDKAMFDFAVSQDVYFDNDGNVTSADGSVLSLATESVYKEPVTYQQYVVRSGDTISSISQKFGLYNISTLIALNNIDNVRYLYSGKKLNIPSMDGLKHKVSLGDTLEGLSLKYNVTVEDLLDVNDLDSSVLIEGQELFVPGAKLDKLSLQKAMGERFSWPITASYRISSNFGSRKDPITGVQSYHTGIDLACPTGTTIKAAMSGTVVYASWSNVFGNYVIIKHIDGYQSLYGHMSKITTKKGAFVQQGAKIGEVGSTGYSTGPHLHFTIYKNGKIVNPSTLLK